MPSAVLLPGLLLAAGLAAAAPAPDKSAARAVPSLIDAVLADPSDSAAREKLGRAARLAAGAERDAASAERSALMTAARTDREKTLAMRAAKKRRIKAWRKDLARVRSLASRGATAGEAVIAYEKLLVRPPVYSDNRQWLADGLEEVRKAFYGTIKKEYPHLLRGRERIDERDIALLFFHSASGQDNYERPQDAGNTQAILKKVETLRRLERDLAGQHALLSRGLAQYVSGRYADATAAFDSVLSFDPGNEEAALYSSFARERAAQKAKEGPGRAGR